MSDRLRATIDADELVTLSGLTYSEARSVLLAAIEAAQQLIVDLEADPLLVVRASGEAAREELAATKAYCDRLSALERSLITVGE